MTEETKSAGKKTAVSAATKNILDAARAQAAAKRNAKAQVPAAGAELAGKAKQYADFLAARKINCFAVVKPNDRPGVIVFRSFLAVEGENLPMWVEFDDTPFVMIYVHLSTKPLGHKKGEVLEYFDDMNARYKVFKYVTNKAQDAVLMSCIPVLPDGFNPELVNAVLDVILKHLEETYADYMRLLWSD